MSDSELSSTASAYSRGTPATASRGITTWYPRSSARQDHAGHAEVHRHPGRDHGTDAEVAQDLVERCRRERRHAVEPRHDDVAGVRRARRRPRRRASRGRWRRAPARDVGVRREREDLAVDRRTRTVGTRRPTVQCTTRAPASRAASQRRRTTVERARRVAPRRPARRSIAPSPMMPFWSSIVSTAVVVGSSSPHSRSSRSAISPPVTA